MPSVACPSCRRVIPPDDVNVGNDVAYCRTCNEAHALSDLVDDAGDEASLDAVDLRHPPSGVWYQESGFETTVGASHRSIPGAVGMLAVALFWNGIVSIFVAFNLLSTLSLLGVGLPEWIDLGEVDNAMGWGMTIFLWLFLTPFMIVGITLVLGFLSCLAGKTEVRIGKDEGVVFVGVGFLGWRRRFDPRCTRLRRASRSWHDDGSPTARQLVLEDEQGADIAFGAGLSETRQDFVAAAVRRALR